MTELVASTFDEVVGIDVEEERLEDFRAQLGHKSKFQILLMSAARIQFPDEFFPFITSFEVPRVWSFWGRATCRHNSKGLRHSQAHGRVACTSETYP